MDKRVDFSKFRQLLVTIENTDVMIRVRSSGEEWSEFSQLLLLSENAMILQQDSRRRIIFHLRNVREFEVNQPLLDLEPNSRYHVVNSDEG